MHFLKWDKSTLPYVSHCAPLWDRDGGDTMFVCLFPPQPYTQMPNFALKSFIHQFQCCMQGPVTTAGKVRKPLWFSVMRSRGHHVMLIFLLCLSPGVITIWSNCISTVPLTQLDNIPVRSLVHVRFSVPGCVTQKLTVNIPFLMHAALPCYGLLLFHQGFFSLVFISSCLLTCSRALLLSSLESCQKYYFPFPKELHRACGHHLLVILSTWARTFVTSHPWRVWHAVLRIKSLDGHGWPQMLMTAPAYKPQQNISWYIIHRVKSYGLERCCWES